MGTKSNPGMFDCHAAALPDETVFTLLGRDPALPATVRFWMGERTRLGKNETDDDIKKLVEAAKAANTAEGWRDALIEFSRVNNMPLPWKLPRPRKGPGDDRPIRMLPGGFPDGVADRETTISLLLDALDHPLVRKTLNEIMWDGTPSVEVRNEMVIRADEVGSLDPMLLRRAARQEGGLSYRFERIAEDLNDGRLPRVGNLYRAVKREGEGTGWAYEAVSLSQSDLAAAGQALRALGDLNDLRAKIVLGLNQVANDLAAAAEGKPIGDHRTANALTLNIIDQFVDRINGHAAELGDGLPVDMLPELQVDTARGADTEHATVAVVPESPLAHDLFDDGPEDEDPDNPDQRPAVERLIDDADRFKSFTLTVSDDTARRMVERSGQDEVEVLIGGDVTHGQVFALEPRGYRCVGIVGDRATFVREDLEPKPLDLGQFPVLETGSDAIDLGNGQQP